VSFVLGSLELASESAQPPSDPAIRTLKYGLLGHRVRQRKPDFRPEVESMLVLTTADLPKVTQASALSLEGEGLSRRYPVEVRSHHTVGAGRPAESTAVSKSIGQAIECFPVDRNSSPGHSDC